MLNKLFVKIVTAAVVLGQLVSMHVNAQTVSNNICTPSGYVLGFFNGVWNDSSEALEGLELLMVLTGDTYNGEKISSELFYNTSGKLTDRPDVTRFEDVAEVFSQRSTELDGVLSNRWEYFWEILKGDSTPLWDKLTSSVTNAASVKQSLITAIQAKTAAAIISMRSTPTTAADYAKHNGRIVALTTEKKKLLLVAHSQGNLFVNQAYNTAKAISSAASVKVVHVAPASAVLNGDYVLADIDIVINRLVRIAPGDTPPANINLALSTSDPSGHELAATYLDSSRPARAKVQGQLRTALGELVSPQTNGITGFFTVTLNWNGSGDVDLHTFEPGGSHVFYSSRIGSSGELDTDNTVANGPEHFYSTCDSTLLQTGAYRIGINNYSGAAGRLATVQVAAARQGEIFTKTLDVGSVRGSAGNNTPITVVTVTVSKDSSGTFNVSAQ